jgi:protein-S-isoprenylcysteine O-methyltransferase Ste14
MERVARWLAMAGAPVVEVPFVSRGIRPSTTRSTAALWAKSLLNALLFFAIFMAALPAVAHRLLPAALPCPSWVRIGGGATLFIGGLAMWVSCLDVFSRRGRGTPFPLDAPRQLVTEGLFGVIRNPIMAGELAVIWGEAVYFARLGILLYALIITLLAHLLVVYVEEPELRERFGEQYETYCRRVPRWLPRRSARARG